MNDAQAASIRLPHTRPGRRTPTAGVRQHPDPVPRPGRRLGGADAESFRAAFLP